MTVHVPANADDLNAALGLQRVILDDPVAGRSVIEYLASPHMCHSGGVVQGGFISGWLDQAMAHAAIAATGGELVPMSLELKVSFFGPARPGLVTAEGWIERRGRSTCFLEGRLLGPAGEVLAKASSTARLMPIANVQARAGVQAK